MTEWFRSNSSVNPIVKPNTLDVYCRKNTKKKSFIDSETILSNIPLIP